MPHFRTELMRKCLGDPEETAALYEERSPITHVENVDAPVLVVHGVNDRRVLISRARRFRDSLREAGCEEGPIPPVEGDGAGTVGDFEYRELGEEGHASTDQEQQLRLFQALADFLRRRVGGAAGADTAGD